MITPRRPSTGTPACQSRARPTPTATSAETAPRTRTRTSRTPSSPPSRRRRRRSRLRRRKLPQTSCRPRPRPPSQAYIPGTAVGGPRRVRLFTSRLWIFCLNTAVKSRGAETFLPSPSRCCVVSVQHVCALQQTGLGAGHVASRPALQQRAVAEVEG